MIQIGNIQQDNRFKTNHINNYIKCKLPKHISEKIKIIQLDKNQNKTQLYAAYKKSTLNILTAGLKVKEWKQISHANTNKKITGEVILISGKIDLRMRNITGNKA